MFCEYLLIIACVFLLFDIFVVIKSLNPEGTIRQQKSKDLIMGEIRIPVNFKPVQHEIITTISSVKKPNPDDKKSSQSAHSSSSLEPKKTEKSESETF